MPDILIIMTSSLKDVLHNLPIVADITVHVPGARIDWVVEDAFADFPRLHPRVARVIPVAMRRWRCRLYVAAIWREMAAAALGVSVVAIHMNTLPALTGVRPADPRRAHSVGGRGVVPDAAEVVAAAAQVGIA